MAKKTSAKISSALIEAKDIPGFLLHVQEIHRRFHEVGGCWEPWFRGQQKAKWLLKPKLYRDMDFKKVKAENVEDEMREEFIIRAPKYLRKVQKWLPKRFTGMRGLPVKPVAVWPTHVVRRISSQHSCFTLHGRDEAGLDRLLDEKNPCLVKLVIRGSKVNDIKKDLRVCGINESTIFPDLDGLGRSINARWGIDDQCCADKNKDT